MDLKRHLHDSLVNTRAFSEQLLADFRTPQQWVHQVHPQANHALWFAGHLGTSDNFFLKMVATQRYCLQPEYQEKFGPGSQPTGDPSDYPPAEQVLAYMRERRAALLQSLADFTEQQLRQPTPAGSPAFLPDFASVFSTASWHECMHAGQLTVVRRALGYPPLFDASPQNGPAD